MAAFDQTTRRTVYKLAFGRYGGLIVRARKPSVRGWKLLSQAIDVLGEDWTSVRQPLSARIDAWECLALAFADALIGWDLLDDGVAVPATDDGVLAQDHAFLIDVAKVWYQRVVLLLDKSTAIPDEDDEEPDPETVLASLPTVVRDAPPLPDSDDDSVEAISGSG